MLAGPCYLVRIMEHNYWTQEKKNCGVSNLLPDSTVIGSELVNIFNICDKHNIFTFLANLPIILPTAYKSGSSP